MSAVLSARVQSLCLRDSPANDISSGSYNFHKVRTAFAGCHGILSSTAYLRAGILSSRQHGRAVQLRGHYEPEDMSILSTVMGITQETLNHRRLVQELYDKQVLHRIVGVKPQAGSDKKGGSSKGGSVSSSSTAPVVVNGHSHRDSAASSSKTRASKAAVDSAWDGQRGANYYDGEDDEEGDYDFDSRRRSADQSFDNDEGGRYDIGRQPLKKRRRTGRAEDAPTVYFEEDEDTEEAAHGAGREDSDDSESGDSDAEVLHIAGASAREKEKERSREGARDSERSSSRRAYWLAKSAGIEGGGLDGDKSMEDS